MKVRWEYLFPIVGKMKTAHHIENGQSLVLPGSIAYPSSSFPAGALLVISGLVALLVVGGHGGETDGGHQP